MLKKLMEENREILKELASIKGDKPANRRG
jgi:hypothetical protein